MAKQRRGGRALEAQKASEERAAPHGEENIRLRINLGEMRIKPSRKAERGRDKEGHIYRG